MTFNTIRQPAYLLLLLCGILSFASVSAEEAVLTKKVSGEDAGATASAGVPASNGSGSGKYTQDEIFNSLDTNHDSKFDLKDFYVLDQNHDGKITKSEVTSQFSGVGASASAAADNDTVGGFTNAFTSSTAMIIATEIGDKTFFIAAVLSMRNSRVMVFAGGIFALICMTILSTMMGLILPSVLPRQYTHIIGGLLFLYFGIKLIYDSRSMSDRVSDELEEVEEELNIHTTNKKNEDKKSGDSMDEEGGVGASGEAPSGTSIASGNAAPSGQVGGGGGGGVGGGISTETNVLFQSFILTFLAEWGDRSQIATIALAAAKDPYGVTIGACFGHSLCTGMAVVGGRMLASKISEKTVSFWGGCIFLAFGVHALFLEE
jgi:putative Ca2+/H+ antiporter (TMEM165/GDT1 family)